MINISELLRKVIQAKIGPYSHKNIKDLLDGKKGKIPNKDIIEIRMILRRELTRLDKTLEKLQPWQNANEPKKHSATSRSSPKKKSRSASAALGVLTTRNIL